MANRFKSAVRLFRKPILTIVFLIVITWIPTSCNQPSPVLPAQEIPSKSVSIFEQGGIPNMEDNPPLISLQLSEGRAQPQTPQPPPLATGAPLTQAEIEQVLARLPMMVAPPQEQVEFKLAQDPIPPPRLGETIQETFPPTTNLAIPTPVAAGPLEVLRFAPEGEIPLAPFVSVTFNQPMTALATVAELAAQKVPVQVEPPLPGTWRWQGTRTLTFEYNSTLIDRLPKATEYRLTIPAGTRSATGGVLAKEVSWSFTTPPPVLQTKYPVDIPQPQSPLFFASFDQRIDPAAVLETIQVTAGNKTIPLALASAEQIQADEQVSRLVKNTPEGRWLAFRAKQLLPTDTTISVMVGPGTPSAEGPLVTKEVQSFSFHTYAPLRVVDQNCNNFFDRCSPLQPFYIRFNNPLDAAQAADSLVRIEPELPGAQVDVSGDSLIIQGASQGRTTYTVTLGAQLQDDFGQNLGQDVDLRFSVGSAEPALTAPQQNLVTLDPTATKPVYSVYAINYPRLDVQIYAVQPSDWPAYLTYRQEVARTDQIKPAARPVGVRQNDQSGRS